MEFVVNDRDAVYTDFQSEIVAASPTTLLGYDF